MVLGSLREVGPVFSLLRRYRMKAIAPLFFVLSTATALNLDDCITILNQADTNGDGALDLDEYKIVVKALQCLESDSLTLAETTVFNSIACQCAVDQGPDCCLGSNARISLMSMTPTQACLYMDSTLDDSACAEGDATTSTCFREMVLADNDGDEFLSLDEYQSFLQAMSCSAVVDAELTLEQHAVFNFFACLCEDQPEAAPDCCVGDGAQINAVGAADPSRLSEVERQALQLVCVWSRDTLESCPVELVSRESPESSSTRCSMGVGLLFAMALSWMLAI